MWQRITCSNALDWGNSGWQNCWQKQICGSVCQPGTDRILLGWKMDPHSNIFKKNSRENQPVRDTKWNSVLNMSCLFFICETSGLRDWLTRCRSQLKTNHWPVSKATVHHCLQQCHLLLCRPSRLQNREVWCLNEEVHSEDTCKTPVWTWAEHFILLTMISYLWSLWCFLYSKPLVKHWSKNSGRQQGWTHEELQQHVLTY